MQSEGNEGRLRVVVADDHSLLRQGQVSMLEAQGFEVVAEAADGLRAAAAIRRAHPETGVRVLSQYVEAGYALELIGDDARGVGYLLKDRIADFREVAGALRRGGAGGAGLGPPGGGWGGGRPPGGAPGGGPAPRRGGGVGPPARGRS